MKVKFTQSTSGQYFIAVGDDDGNWKNEIEIDVNRITMDDAREMINGIGNMMQGLSAALWRAADAHGKTYLGHINYETPDVPAREPKKTERPKTKIVKQAVYEMNEIPPGIAACLKEKNPGVQQVKGIWRQTENKAVTTVSFYPIINGITGKAVTISLPNDRPL